MPANFQVGATFDKSQIDEGFDASAASAQTWAERLDVIFGQAAGASKRAFKSISDDSKAAAASVSEDQTRVAAAARALVVANNDVKNSQALLKAGTVDEATAMQLLAASLERAAVAQREFKAAQEGVAEASHVTVSGVQATSAAIRSLEGNAGIRAVENFVAKTLGLGPALQAIFPLVGAIAFGVILFDLGEKVVELYEKADGAAKALSESFTDMHEKAQVANDDLAIQNDKLQDEIDKLSGHPNNGLVTALDEARKMADKLLESLAADRKELDSLLKEHEVTTFGSVLSGVASTGTQAAQVMADQAGLTDQVRQANAKFNAAMLEAKNPTAIKAATDARNASVKEAFQSQIATYKKEAARLQNEQKESEDAAQVAMTGPGGGEASVNTTDNSAKIAIAAGRAQQLQDALNKEMLEQSIGQKEQTVGGLRQNKADGAAGNKADEERFKQIEEGLNKLKTQGPLTAQAELEYWQEAEAGFRVGSSEYRSIIAKEGELTQQIIRKVHEEIEAQKKKDRVLDGEGGAALDKGNEAMSRWAEVTSQNLTRTGDHWEAYWKDVTKGQEITAAIADNISIAQLKALEASGGITKLGAAQVEAAIHAREHAAALKALEAELAALEKNASRNALGNVDDPKQAAQIQGVKNQISQEKGKGAVQGVQDTAGIAAEMSKHYLNAINTVESGWMTAQRQMLTGQKSFTQAMKGLFANFAMDAIQNIEKVGFQMLKTEVSNIAAHKAAAQANNQTDAIASQQSVTIDAMAALKKMNHSASVAAGKAWGAFADIPVVGPELGAVAAAATYAGVMALAAFDTGTAYVPHDGIAMIHKGESVLPPPQTSVLMNALNGNSGSGDAGDMHVHLGGNNFAQSGGDFKSQWAQNERHIATRLKKMKRDGKI